MFVVLMVSMEGGNDGGGEIIIEKCSTDFRTLTVHISISLPILCVLKCENYLKTVYELYVDYTSFMYGFTLLIKMIHTYFS